ncbi:hypothetical protein [Gimibacter soli]|uniref:Uncharacterized protein n=1 Tax=Gimibacter soli TaxID=3024400 RepID=A0AAE9XSZ8_9PROT|nr:hypothetical protein [Gimibacter soli]WCL54535.1 hypothetical protein PH603_02030 [Gimibacter soli]
MTDKFDADDGNRAANPAGDLAFIRAMMDAGRRRAGIDGAHMIIWGIILAVAFFLQYASVVGRLPVLFLEIWVPAFIIGFPLSFWIGRKTPGGAERGNIALAAYSTVWLSVGVVMGLYMIAGISTGHFDGRDATMLASALFGTAYFVVAKVTQLNWMYACAAGWWLFFFQVIVQSHLDREILLQMAGACLVLILLPGLVLRRMAGKA